MAKSLKDLQSNLTKKKSPTTTTRKRTTRKTTAAPATPAEESEKLSVANPTELAKQAVQRLEQTDLPAPDFGAMVPSDSMRASSSIAPISEAQHEQEREKQKGQIRAVDVMSGNFELVAAIEKAKATLAKAAQQSITKGAEVQNINAAIARFDSATEKAKAEEAKAIQSRIEREGIEAMAPIVREKNEAMQAQARARISQIESRTEKLLNPDSKTVDVDAIEV